MRAGGRDLLLDLLEDVGHLAEEVLCGEAAVTPGPGPSTRRHGGVVAAPARPRLEVGGTQSAAVPPSHSQAEDGVVGPREAQGTARTPDTGRVPPSSWPGPGSAGLHPPGRPPSAQTLSPTLAVGAAKGSTGRLKAGQLTTDKPGLGFWWGWGPPPGLGRHTDAPVAGARERYLGLLGDIQHELELLRHGQVFLRRLLQPKGTENFHQNSAAQSNGSQQQPRGLTAPEAGSRMPPHRGAGCPGRRPPGAREGGRAAAAPSQQGVTLRRPIFKGAPETL